MPEIYKTFDAPAGRLVSEIDIKYTERMYSFQERNKKRRSHNDHLFMIRDCGCSFYISRDRQMLSAMSWYIFVRGESGSEATIGSPVSLPTCT